MLWHRSDVRTLSLFCTCRVAQCDGTELTITLDFDSYAPEASWDLTSDSGDIIASGVGTTNNSSETATACVADGCYTFTMNDSWGDGGTAYSVLILTEMCWLVPAFDYSYIFR